MTNKKSVITVRVNEKLKQKLIKKAKREGMSFSEAVRYALRKWSES